MQNEQGLVRKTNEHLIMIIRIKCFHFQNMLGQKLGVCDGRKRPFFEGRDHQFNWKL